MTAASVQGLRSRPLLLPLAALASAVTSQMPAAASPQDNGSILVRGEPLTRDAARDKAQQFVRAVGVAAGETPAARWIDPICPVVIGLNDAARNVAEGEVRRIAREVGAPLAPVPCDKNLAITFTSDGGGLARAIADRDPSRLTELSPNARDAVLKGNGPIRWWYTTDRRSRDGAPGNAGLSSAGGTNQNDSGSGYGASLPNSGMMQYGSGVLSTFTQRIITSAIVIVDTDDVQGRSLQAVAGYAALVGLAEIRDPGAKPAGSILAMFDSPATRRLTREDEAFLKALYRLPLDRKAQLHRGALIGDMTKDMTAAR
jgi:hypothetical protein